MPSSSDCPSAPVLVTGATGLVGSELTIRLLEQGFTVRIFRRETSSLEALGSAQHEVDHAIGDLTDPWSVREAMADVRHVFHVAAQLPGASAAALQAVNVQGTANVVNAAIDTDVSRLVHTSSISALGRPANGPTVIDEATMWSQGSERSAYARSKRKAELEVFRGIAEGLDAVIVNPGFIFGVGRAGENTRQIVDIARKGWARVAPAGGTGFVDARDVADGIIRAFHLGETGERYLLSSQNLRWKDVLSELALAFDEAPPQATLPPVLAKGLARLSEALAFVTRTDAPLSRSMARTMSSHHRYSSEKARAELGWFPRPFRETARHISDQLDTNGRGSGGAAS